MVELEVDTTLPNSLTDVGDGLVALGLPDPPDDLIASALGRFISLLLRLCGGTAVLVDGG